MASVSCINAEVIQIVVHGCLVRKEHAFMNNALKAIPVSLAKFVLMDFAFYTNVQVLFIVQLALNVQEASARNRKKV